MTRGKNGTASTKTTKQTMTGEVIDAAHERDLALAQQAIELAPFGDGMEFGESNLTAVTLELRTLGAMSAQLIFEIGRRLIWVQQGLDDDQSFAAWLSEQVGFSRRTAFNYMAVARRAIAGGPEFARLLAGGSVSKAYALLEFTDEEARELVEGGKVGDLTLEKAETMSAAELRRELRKRNRQVAKGREQTHRLEDRIADLEAEAGQRAEAVGAEFTARVTACHLAIERLVDLCRDCPDEDALAEMAGSEKVYRKLMVGLMKRCDDQAVQARRIQPRGRKAKVGPKR